MSIDNSLYKGELKVNKKVQNNYHIGTLTDINKLSDYKNLAFFNGVVHSLGLAAGIVAFAMMPGAVAIGCAFLNAYCLMLQRYNTIRINETIAKYYESKQVKDDTSIIPIDKLNSKNKKKNDIVLTETKVIDFNKAASSTKKLKI